MPWKAGDRGSLAATRMRTPKNSRPKHRGGSTESRAGLPAPSPPVAETGAASAASVPVVGVGASAGGLEALRQLFGHLPRDPGIAFVVVQHLDPDRPSMLASVLEGVTGLPVVEAESGMPAKPNRVHVIPSGSDISIEHGLLRLSMRALTGRLHPPS